MPRLIAVPFFLCYFLGLLAQNPHPYFRNYTTDDGLPSAEVHYCMQDTAGYMWFATDNGLSRFDGYEFKNYGPREGLKHNVIFYMQQDPKGIIWLATMHGQLYYIDKDSIHAFAQNEVIEKINTKPNFIKDFYIAPDGSKYLAIFSEGILKFSNTGDYEQHFPSSLNTPGIALNIGKRWLTGTQSPPNSLSAKHNDQQLNLNSNSLIEIQTDSTFVLNINPLTKRTISSGGWIKQLKNNRMLGLRTSVIFEYKGENLVWDREADFDLELKSFIQDTKDRLLLGLLRGKGIRRYENIEALRTNDFEQFLDGNSITHIFQDRWGAYWIGTIENGIFYCPDFDLKIYDTSSGFPNNHITALDFKANHQAYIGFRNGQVLLFDFLQNRLDMMPPLANNIVYDLWYDPSRQDLWATDGRPNLLDKGKWKTQVYSIDSPVSFSKKMTKSRDKNLIWGGGHLGFGSVNLDTKTKDLLSFDLGIRNRTLRVWEDQQHRIWIGNVNGLFEFKNNKLEPPQPFYEPFKTRTEDIAELSDGTLVIATKGEGVLFWKENKFHQLTTTEGLTSNMLENIYVDDKDRIWVGTIEGLNKITRTGDTFKVEKYTTFHGLPSNEITRVTSHQGQVWIATTKGLLQWKEKGRSDFSPSPIFETTQVNNSPTDLHKTPNLTYDQNDLEIHFLTINYHQNGNIPYRFRLNDDDWNYTKNKSVNFADLPPTAYRFEVQSQNENGDWSKSSILNFKIHPAFWQTWWFILLSISALIGIFVLIYRYRLQQVKHNAQVEKEINELERAALRAQMNPHFIFNCLNSIQNFIVQNDALNASRYLAKFAQLVRGTLNASMEKKILLQNEIKLLENYLNLEKLRFKDKFNFSIHVDPQLNIFELTIPPLLTQPFVENAILHAFSENGKIGHIQIDYLKKKEMLEISIRDNGIGIFQSQRQKKAIESDMHKGVGMSISKKRLELADVLNEFEVKEIIGLHGKVEGTLVRLVLERSYT